MTALLAAVGATTRFPGGARVGPADLAVDVGHALGVVGRSGSGKTTLVRMLLGLTPLRSGTVLWRGAPVPAGAGAAARAVRRELTYVPQDPAGSLDPRRTVRRALTDPLRRLGVDGDRAAHEARVAEALAAVGLKPDVADRRPPTLSGGQAQRAAIARALVTGARVVVADEPVSGLDHALRDQVLDLLAGLVRSGRIGLVWVSHDLDATARLCDDLLVLDAGAVVERGPADVLLRRPAHPATRALVEARLEGPTPAAVPAR
ncbi:ATP-binding cassette domain-containing protein [Nocardioides sp. CFH 31398]|uniref:ATP-binding cassette domain-containing protein n=1 Tax=Nocardioides sp. CFH 31398 TaxID=2919579 RepID=UPI001F05FE84|nr:ATP-binding cassette domain-containing protein [Nocardioides sp. CFH 31398]MCH1866246.1 ATP-binding cassette domain-containing protein [Nocardioides sp. CFH 31398]